MGLTDIWSKAVLCSFNYGFETATIDRLKVFTLIQNYTFLSQIDHCVSFNLFRYVTHSE